MKVNGEHWIPTAQLRILVRRDDNVIQQLWVCSDDGREEWRLLPVVEE